MKILRWRNRKNTLLIVRSNIINTHVIIPSRVSNAYIGIYFILYLTTTNNSITLELVWWVSENPLYYMTLKEVKKEKHIRN